MAVSSRNTSSLDAPLEAPSRWTQTRLLLVLGLVAVFMFALGTLVSSSASVARPTRVGPAVPGTYLPPPPSGPRDDASGGSRQSQDGDGSGQPERSGKPAPAPDSGSAEGSAGAGAPGGSGAGELPHSGLRIPLPRETRHGHLRDGFKASCDAVYFPAHAVSAWLEGARTVCTEQVSKELTPARRWHRASDSPVQPNDIDWGAECFTHAHYREGKDTFCVFRGLVIEGGKPKATSVCPRLDSSYLSMLPSFMYDSGLANVFRALDLSGTGSVENTGALIEQRGWVTTPTVLLRRDAVHNLFHFSADLLALYVTLEIAGLDETRDVRVVVVDNKEKGPYWELLSVFSKHPVVHVSDLGSQSLNLAYAIFSLPCGSSYMWDRFWKPVACRDSPLYDEFRLHVLQHFDLLAGDGNLGPMASPKVRVVIVSRDKQKPRRNWSNQQEALALLRDSQSDVDAKAVDFQGMPLRDQIQAVLEADVLIGVHGAGLTHAMWLHDDAVVVELFPPKTKPAAFRNIARLRGLVYVAEKCDPPPAEFASTDWHEAPVSISMKRLAPVLDTALRVARQAKGVIVPTARPLVDVVREGALLLEQQQQREEHAANGYAMASAAESST